MTTRATSWYPLAATDPVPGDPAVLTQQAAAHREVAAQIRLAADSLVELTSDPRMRSLAVDTLRERAAGVAGTIRKARARYLAVADALSTYAVALRQAQEAADDLLARARTTQQSLDEAVQQRLRAAVLLRDLEDDPAAAATDVRATTNRLETARTAVDDAELRLTTLRDELEIVERERDAAARRAIDTIDEARASDGLDDGWWEDWGLEVATQVSAIAGKVATIAGTAALVLCWVPILGPALALTATIAGAASLVANVMLAAKGEKGWADAGIDALGMLSFGWGKVVGKGLQQLSREMPDALTAVRGFTSRSGNPAVAAGSGAVDMATRGLLASSDLTVRGLLAGGWRSAPGTYLAAFRTALFQVGAGPKGLLTMAGHGDVVANRALLDDVASVATHPKAVDLLNPLLAKASSLEQQVVWIHGIDVAANAYGAGQLASELTSPPQQSARERLHL
ncbi:hypothetical protein H9657_17790 [Cellulomonas sp. Sa3CUA2]|uniref:Chromosome partition protein Smc n=1 Tax=Cellulomonas avistercoris TaxID=2762242 RepID=A0ABR8QI63_9CELL|nr:hypothetical protein [Cellulomonas avistercoris]MBD7920128.1 hypothetical protein [Cellulomonas avistercoris]